MRMDRSAARDCVVGSRLSTRPTQPAELCMVPAHPSGLRYLGGNRAGTAATAIRSGGNSADTQAGGVRQLEAVGIEDVPSACRLNADPPGNWLLIEFCAARPSASGSPLDTMLAPDQACSRP